MNSGLVMMEFQDIETHLNLIMDFAESRVRMLKTMASSGRDIVDSMNRSEVAATKGE